VAWYCVQAQLWRDLKSNFKVNITFVLRFSELECNKLISVSLKISLKNATAVPAET
jgi:hypothetical protein